MNAHYRKLADKERISIYHSQADNIAQATIAATLLAMHRRGRSKKYIQDLFSDILGVLNQPELFGQQMTDIDIKNFITEQYGINFDEVHLKLESETEIRIRERQEELKGAD